MLDCHFNQLGLVKMQTLVCWGLNPVLPTHMQGCYITMRRYMQATDVQICLYVRFVFY